MAALVIGLAAKLLKTAPDVILSFNTWGNL